VKEFVPWITGALIIFIFSGVIWFNRRRMRAEVSRMRGGNPDFMALAVELRRSNDILEKTLQNHEARLKTLEDKNDPDAGAKAAGISQSLN